MPKRKRLNFCKSVGKIDRLKVELPIPTPGKEEGPEAPDAEERVPRFCVVKGENMLSEDAKFIVASNLVVANELRRILSHLQGFLPGEDHGSALILIFQKMMAQISDLTA